MRGKFLQVVGLSTLFCQQDWAAFFGSRVEYLILAVGCYNLFFEQIGVPNLASRVGCLFLVAGWGTLFWEQGGVPYFGSRAGYLTFLPGWGSLVPFFGSRLGYLISAAGTATLLFYQTGVPYLLSGCGTLFWHHLGVLPPFWRCLSCVRKSEASTYTHQILVNTRSSIGMIVTDGARWPPKNRNPFCYGYHFSFVYISSNVSWCFYLSVLTCFFGGRGFKIFALKTDISVSPPLSFFPPCFPPLSRGTRFDIYLVLWMRKKGSDVRIKQW